MGAAVWRFAPSPVPVDHEPAVDLGGGWWRIANGDKRLWQTDVAVTAEAHRDGWDPVTVLQVAPLAGCVRLEGRVDRVRLSTSFLPLTPVATAPRWTLNLDLAVPSATLGGTRGPSKPVGAVCELQEPQLLSDAGKGAFLVELQTGRGAYYAIGSAAIPDHDVLRVTVDPASCRHHGWRARP